ncbi:MULTISPECIES: hypothetical protein [unclassified Shinella]|uniref:hypothetical protein n=1 Tax=unclassified Shinella TaxID=2643062 RepID=UPI00225D3620|nr:MULTISPECIES: hypothetical protein [unclassified Shinella]MCO5139988.1 hypothetical protein [Shinella sp.]MDC7256994.1 hypothetical protein [Shinella sp. YE25]CAI0339888.1 hypothetical protein SHINE37_43750 [Rhizobiaceae bacterium]
MIPARTDDQTVAAHQLAVPSKNRYMRGMESKFGCTEKHVVVLQDHKRLPARFFARVFGALISRLS